MTDHFPDARLCLYPWSGERRQCVHCPRPVVWVKATENRDDVRRGQWVHEVER